MHKLFSQGLDRDRAAGWLVIAATMAVLAMTLTRGGSSSDAASATDANNALITVPPASKQLARYAFESTESLTVAGLPSYIKMRDPVYLQNDDGSLVQAGYVIDVDTNESSTRTTIRWYARDVAATQCVMEAKQNRGRLEDLLVMMFPPEKRQRIEMLITDAMKTHGERLTQRLLPIFERSMRESLPAIEAGFRESVNRHRQELDALGAKWNREIMEQRLLPLAKSEVVPIVRRHGEPVAQVVGRELWDRASLWSFTWRAIYDKTPLPRKDLMKQEWERFVEQEAIPIFEEHAGEIATAVQDIMIEITQNSTIRAEVAGAADAIASDPQARALVQTILRESMIENIALRETWARAWTSDEAKRAIAEAGNALEPTIRKIGDELMGTRERGIDPGFAKLLRNQVLQKDQRWILAKQIR
jgi:hypothetical protein